MGGRFRRYSKEDPEHGMAIHLSNLGGEYFYIIVRLFTKINTELCEAVFACDIVENITRYKDRSKEYLRSIAL
jgi:hypothetical protein